MRAPHLLEFAKLIKNYFNTMKIEKLEFLASLPPTTSAIQISGQGDGAILKLDIPASELYSIVQLQLLANKVFKVTIEQVDDKNGG